MSIATYGYGLSPGAGGGTTATVILAAPELVEGLTGAIMTNTLEGSIVEPLEGTIEE